MKGVRVRGEKALLRNKHRSLRYHAADKNGWMYWCDCMPTFRLGGKYKSPTGNRNQKTKIMYTRWIARGAN